MLQKSADQWVFYLAILALGLWMFFSVLLPLGSRFLKQRNRAAIPQQTLQPTPENQSPLVLFNSLTVEYPYPYSAFYQVKVNVTSVINRCSVWIYFDGIDTNSNGLQMHWQSSAGLQDNGVPVLNLHPGVEYTIPFIRRIEPNGHRRDTSDYPFAAWIIDAEYLTTERAHPEYFPAGSVKYVEFAIRSNGREFRSGRVFKVSVPRSDRPNTEFIVEKLKP